MVCNGFPVGSELPYNLQKGQTEISVPKDRSTDKLQAWGNALESGHSQSR